MSKKPPIIDENTYISFSHCGSNMVLGPSHIQNRTKSKNIAVSHKLRLAVADSFIALSNPG
jgi:hypothetical protein